VFAFKVLEADICIEDFDQVPEGAAPAGRPPTVIDGVRPENQVRSRLPAGGSRIRTIGPTMSSPGINRLICWRSWFLALRLLRRSCLAID
jgi:hypothetical protein